MIRAVGYPTRWLAEAGPQRCHMVVIVTDPSGGSAGAARGERNETGVVSSREGMTCSTGVSKRAALGIARWHRPTECSVDRQMHNKESWRTGIPHCMNNTRKSTRKHTRTHAHTHTRTHPYTQHIHTHTHPYIYARTHASTHARTHIYAHTHTPTMRSCGAGRLLTLPDRAACSVACCCAGQKQSVQSAGATQLSLAAQPWSALPAPRMPSPSLRASGGDAPTPRASARQ